MRIKLYADIGLETKKEDIFFTQQPNSYKLEGHKRFEVVVTIPDMDDLVDFALKDARVKEIEG